MNNVFIFGEGNFLDFRSIIILLEKNFFVYYKCINAEFGFSLDGLRDNIKFKFLDKLHLKNADLKDFFEEANIDFVINLSGLVYPKNPEQAKAYFFSQIEFSEMLIQSISGHSKKRIIYVVGLGYEIFGSSDQDSFDDKSLVNPSCLIASYKASAYLISKSFAKSLNIDFNFAFSSNIYGTEIEASDLPYIFAFRLFEKKIIQIQGNGEYLRNWIYIDDLIYGIILIFQKGITGESYFFGGDEDKLHSCVDIAFKVCDNFNLLQEGESFDYRSLVKFSGGDVYDLRRSINSSKAKNFIDYSPSISIDAGIEIICKRVMCN